MKGKKVRVGAGSAYELDRIDSAVELAERGEVQYICFETLAERTLAFAQIRKMGDPSAGYNPLTEERLRAVLPACVENGIKIIGNFGAANPIGAAGAARRVIDEMGFEDVTVATVLGDDVSHLVTPSMTLWETGGPLSEQEGEIVSANAYIGAEPIAAALQAGADVVITGRAADPSLFLAPLMHEFRWRPDDWDRLGAGTVVGHLLECTEQVTGGTYLDPGCSEDVPGVAHLGFPIAEVYEDGEAAITKTPGTGGMVTRNTCKAQLLWELHDPEAYLTPDVAADFSRVRFEEIRPDVVGISGARGRERPSDLKVLIGIRQGYIGEGQVSWAGPGCYDKARAAAEMVKSRLEPVMADVTDLRVDFIGVNSILGPEAPEPVEPPNEVRLRIAGRARTEEAAARIAREMEMMWFGPVGAAGVSQEVRPCLAMYSTQIPRDLVRTRVVTEPSQAREPHRV